MCCCAFRESTRREQRGECRNKIKPVMKLNTVMGFLNLQSHKYSIFAYCVMNYSISTAAISLSYNDPQCTSFSNIHVGCIGQQVTCTMILKLLQDSEYKVDVFLQPATPGDHMNC